MSQAKQFPVVGVGASAGGVDALNQLFNKSGMRLGAAYVVVTHLNPDQESKLDQVIARMCDLRVVVAGGRMELQPDTIYVMPPNCALTIDGNHLVTSVLAPHTRERKPIDVFFSSLAKECGEYAVGIVLSGGDGDGTLGLKAIKEQGGLTLAQAFDGKSPSNPSMPDSAVAAGLVDINVPASEMGERLRQFVHGFNLLDDLIDSDGAAEDERIHKARDKIYALLRQHSGHDFSGYKTKTFLRRIKRRMQIGQINTLERYIEVLRNEPDEISALFSDLLINVTNFFRDADAFRMLEHQVVPRLFDGRGAHETVRIWVPGCATGEEVYSIAILMREYMDGLQISPRVQIFATDIDEAALAVARAGQYPEELLADLTPERRERFFTKDGNSFVLRKEIRELCVFSPHSVIRDPPFSRMDMVSCRNLLIYFGADIQAQVIPTFHYALRAGGYLFLGTSESISQFSDLFTTVDKKQRIFQARDTGRAAARLPMLSGGVGALHGRSEDFPVNGQQLSQPIRQAVELQVMDRYGPAHVVVNREGDVVHSSARTSRFLELPKGAPSRQILTMAKRDLRLDLRSALTEAAETRRPSTRMPKMLEEDGTAQVIRLTVEPLGGRSSENALLIVLFEPMLGSSVAQEAEPRATDRDLELDLRDTRERLQSTIEEYETALEELKASNEELVSVNEEAQSTNEELEASKEEMQSLNEELHTINAELHTKVEELDRASSDLRNLFDSSQIATVFLDRNLVIRNFTPAASSFFNLRSSDVGRPLTDLSSILKYPQMRGHIEQVFASGKSLEYELGRNETGEHHLVRLMPYRDASSTANGVIVTFVDVTKLANARDQQQILVDELNHRVRNMLAIIISITNQTLRTTSDPAQFADALMGRMKAMSRAYTIVSREDWKHVDVRSLIAEELAPFGEDRARLEGPNVRIDPESGLSLALVLHEMVTNAAKYGALSVDEGHIDLRWQVLDGTITLLWRERGGPIVATPERIGFGSRLIATEIEQRQDGHVEIRYAPGGFEADLQFSLK